MKPNPTAAEIHDDARARGACPYAAAIVHAEDTHQPDGWAVAALVAIARHAIQHDRTPARTLEAAAILETLERHTSPTERELIAAAEWWAGRDEADRIRERTRARTLEDITGHALALEPHDQRTRWDRETEQALAIANRPGLEAAAAAAAAAQRIRQHAADALDGLEADGLDPETHGPTLAATLAAMTTH